MNRILEFLLFIVAVVCFAYSIIVYNVHSGSKFYLFWDALAVVFVALGILIGRKIFTKTPVWLNRTLVSILIACICLFFVLLGLVMSTFKSKGSRNLDYIIVLGAQVRTDGPSVVLRFRLEKATEYLKENPETKCIVSGGQGSNEPKSEARAMADYLIEHGIAEDRILLEDKSTNTSQNLQFSKKLLPENVSVGIVTNNFHVKRALYLAKRFGLTNAEGIAAYSTPLYAPNNVVREMIGLVKDFIIR